MCDCRDGFYYNKDTCNSCPDGCKKCQVGSSGHECTECVANSYLLSGECICSTLRSFNRDTKQCMNGAFMLGVCIGIPAGILAVSVAVVASILYKKYMRRNIIFEGCDLKIVLNLITITSYIK